MKPIGPFTVVVMLLLSTTVASVAASGYGPGAPGAVPSPVPSLSYYGAPSLVGTQETDFVSFAFPDGVAVSVKQSSVKLELCTASGCTAVAATLTQTGAGYDYSFTIPSTVSGSVDVILPAGSLTDQYGAPFPSVDTVIGTFTAGSSASAPAAAGSPLTKIPPLMRTTNPVEQTAQPQVNLLIPSLLALLSIIGVALLAFPTKTR